MLAYALALACLLTMSDCKSARHGVLGCCDTKGSGFASEYAEDYPRGASTAKEVCASLKGTWTDSACGATDIVAGCRADKASQEKGTTDWYYKSSVYPEVDAVARKCVRRTPPGTTLLPDRREAP